MFHMRRAGDFMIMQSDLLPVLLKHAFTTRRLSTKTGPVKAEERPNFRIDAIEDTSEWWIKLRDWLFTPRHTCFMHNQVHRGSVRVINPEKSNGEVREVNGFKFALLGDGDGIIKPFSRVPSFIAVTTADCLPCIAYDPDSRTVAAVHAGWRGLAADIIGNSLRTFKTELGIPSKNLLWAIGPSINPDNYEVGNEVIAALETAGYAETDWQDNADTSHCGAGWIPSKRRDHYMVNLSALAAMRLQSLGVPLNQIDICNLSTFDNPNLFYSYRRDGKISGLQATVIG